MKLENQVCTLEQAKRLKELGVCQDSQCYWRRSQVEHIDGVNSWPDQQTLREMIVEYDGAGEVGWQDRFEIYSAFTVGELGVMLGFSPYAVYLKKDNIVFWHADYEHMPFGAFPTEAEAKAAILIHQLENNLITAAEINQRLK